MIIDSKKVDPDQPPEFTRRDPYASPSRGFSVPTSHEAPEYGSYLLPPAPPRHGLRTMGSTPDLRLRVESPTGSSTSPTTLGSTYGGLGQLHTNGSSLNLLPLHFMQKGMVSITGAYRIDPRTNPVGFDDSKGFTSKKTSLPLASFRAKNGEIDISLETVGKVKKADQKVDVLCATTAGNITVRLLTPEPGDPPIGLEIFSLRGDILLLLPPSYCGMFHLKTHWGDLKYLPHLKSAMKIIHEAKGESVVMLGNHFVQDQTPTNFAQMKTRFGTIILGFNGRDTYDFKNGFWQTVMKKF